jgi:hypothetical protein
VVELTNVVGTLWPLTRTREVLSKPLPDTVIVREVVPARTLLGETEFKTGALDCALTVTLIIASIRHTKMVLLTVDSNIETSGSPIRGDYTSLVVPAAAERLIGQNSFPSMSSEPVKSPCP